jgi:hypothetical protein
MTVRRLLHLSVDFSLVAVRLRALALHSVSLPLQRGLRAVQRESGSRDHLRGASPRLLDLVGDIARLDMKRSGAGIQPLLQLIQCAFPLIESCFSCVRPPFPLVGQSLSLIGQLFAIVRTMVTCARHNVPLVRETLPLVTSL